jgi:hypothetical protein
MGVSWQEAGHNLPAVAAVDFEIGNRLRRKRRWPFGELATGGSSASAPLRRDNLRLPFARALSWWVSDLKPDPRAGGVARCWLQI